MSKSFDQGRSTGEAEGTPMYGGPEQFRRVSGGTDQYVGAGSLLPPDCGCRNQPINGNVAPERHEVMGVWALRAAENLSEPQQQHGLIRLQRGMRGKQDYPDDAPGGPPTGKIKAVHRYGLGAAVQRPADLGHDPGEDQVDTDYRRQPEGPAAGVLDKYMGAASLLPQPTGPGSGYPLEHTGSQFECMGDDMISMAANAARRAR